MEIKDERLLKIIVTRKETDLIDAMLITLFNELGDEMPPREIGQFFTDIYLRQKANTLGDENGHLIKTNYYYED